MRIRESRAFMWRSRGRRFCQLQPGNLFLRVFTRSRLGQFRGACRSLRHSWSERQGRLTTSCYVTSTLTAPIQSLLTPTTSRSSGATRASPRSAWAGRVTLWWNTRRGKMWARRSLLSGVETWWWCGGRRKPIGCTVFPSARVKRNRACLELMSRFGRLWMWKGPTITPITMLAVGHCTAMLLVEWCKSPARVIPHLAAAILSRWDCFPDMEEVEECTEECKCRKRMAN